MTATTTYKRQDETPMVRANRLLAEARAAAMEQVQALEEALETATLLSGEIADGGDIYPAGVRELCRRVSEDSVMHAKTLSALSARLMAPRAR